MAPRGIDASYEEYTGTYGRTSDITEITSAETEQVLTKMKNGKATVDLINYG